MTGTGSRTHPLVQLREDMEAFVFPAGCLHCGIRVEHISTILCPGCVSQLDESRIAPRHMLRSRDFMDVGGHLKGAVCVWDVNPVIRSLIHCLKYRGFTRVASFCGPHLSAQLRSTGLAGAANLVQPIPLHPGRLRERGFNQSWEICQSLNLGEHVQVVNDLVKRTRMTKSQTKLNRKQRLANVREAFQVAQPEAVEEKCIVLVDDVVTSGATASSCARVLRESGAREVWVASVARAGWHQGRGDDDFTSALLAGFWG